MVTKVLICKPHEYEQKEKEFLQLCYAQLNTKENGCDDIFFYAHSKTVHDGDAHYFTFVYDKYMD